MPRLRGPGLRLTNHAGETTGSEAIREALAIGSERIGHALSAGQGLLSDPGVEGAAYSSGVEPDFKRPHRRLSVAADPPAAASISTRACMVTLNSDDPAFFASDVANEYLLAHTIHGFSREELRQLAANSIHSSFLPKPAKAAWLARIDSAKSTIFADFSTVPGLQLEPGAKLRYYAGQEAAIHVY
jgi:aminodeoxyfutalosine deaminase